MARLDLDDPALVAFMGEYHLASLATVRPDGTPHLVPVGVTYDAETRTARVITRDGSVKVRTVESAGPDGAPVAVNHVDGGQWVTLFGIARVTRDADEIADAVARYARRYRQPRENATRVAIVIDVERVLGNLRPVE
ncbi:PPOX class probable F420-dependent enzyme [Mumia flava]|uniref:PPOX class probable F420-dependent enzyme n=1 Tax=Mumia flava TaxID=1348852 RepID=A0A0B2BJN8_9ACTN|nr:pyridoxamine 5'-phosphate oxidase family protein [Mumia flava]PJJ57349.1 PPOX class probable F420-dependent enzyme [Mumia flava]